MRKSHAPLVILSLLRTSIAQSNPQLSAGTPGINAGSSSFNGSRLCDRNFADANASGIFTYDPNFSVGQTLLPNYNGTLVDPISWAQTVYQSPNTSANNSITELSLWFSPEGKNYSNNFALGYDVCYLWIRSLNINSFERGQIDNGTCLQTLDEECVNDLQNQATQYAVDLVEVPSPGPHSNLTTNSLPTVCGDIASTLTQNFPKSCEVFFNSTRAVFGGAPALGGPMTGNQSYVERAHCQMNGSYSMMWSQYGPATLDNYLVANYWVTPLITTWMPIADVNRPATAAGAKSFMSCLRAKNLNAGSREIPPAPSPTPINKGNSSSPTETSSPSIPSNSDESSGLRGGAIAGTVIAVVVGLAIIAALVVFLLFRKRIQEAMQKKKRSRRGISELDGASGYVEMDQKGFAAEAPGHTVSEMECPGLRAELGDDKEWVAEMPAYREREAINRHPAELAGT